MITIRSIHDEVSGRTYKAIGEEGTHISHNYFTAMTWKSDSRHICVRSHAGEGKGSGGAYFLVDTVRGTSQILSGHPCHGATVSSDDNVFYYTEQGRQIRAIDLNSLQHRLITQLDPDCVASGVLSVSADGSTLGFNMKVRGIAKVGMISAETGELKEIYTPNFPESHPLVSHAMINPIYKHLFFYCHEGRTNEIPDRLWVVDANTGNSRNVFRQKRENGTHVEYVGHEMWDFRGNGLYFVKYPLSPLKPTGVYYVDKLGEHSEFINGDYPYAHVAVSPNGRFCVADTKKDPLRKIVLIDLETRQSEVLCVVDSWGTNAGHSHPSFSPDSRKISFTFADDNNRLHVGVIDL